MPKYGYAIEIGGALTKIYKKDCGLVLCEPTLVAARPTGEGYRIFGLGEEAKKLIGKTTEEVEVFSPISSEGIKNQQYCEKLLEYFFKKVEYRHGGGIVVLCDCAASQEQRDEYRKLLHTIGFHEVAVIPSVIAACVGAGKNVFSSKVSMIVDVGGSATNIAVINMGAIQKGATLSIGGRNIDVAINHAVAQKHGFVIGLSSAERLKNEVASLYPNDGLNIEITGIDMASKMPRACIVTSSDLYGVILPYFEEILRAAQVTITSLPPEFSSDIINGGVLFVGGLTQISGFSDFLQKNFSYPATVLDEADTIAIMGAGKLLDDCALLDTIIQNF